MTDDWVNDPYDEAPVHVLDDDGEPDADEQGGEFGDDATALTGTPEDSDESGESPV